jgi:hypothetical protein
MKLSESEKEYMENDGLQIVLQSFIRDSHLSLGGSCKESREAQREVHQLREIATQKLTLAGVPEARQIFLEKILFSANVNYLKFFPPKEWKHLRNHFSEMWTTNTFQGVFFELIKR